MDFIRYAEAAASLLNADLSEVDGLVAYLDDRPWVCLAPGLAIVITVLGFNLLGDGLRDALDPRLRGGRKV